MPRLHPIILLQEYNKLTPNTGSQIPPNRLVQPPYDFDWSSFSEVIITLEIKAVNGNPTAWSLQPRLEFGIGSTSGYQFTNGIWTQLSQAQATARTSDQWLPDLNKTIYDAIPAGTAPMWYTTIKNPPAMMRINFGEANSPFPFTMTGGTNPNLQAACVAYPKGR